MMSGKKSPWMACPLQWSKDNDDDQAQCDVLQSADWCDSVGQEKNSFYINFTTEGNCF